jgi:hypothetical protein
MDETKIGKKYLEKNGTWQRTLCTFAAPRGGHLYSWEVFGQADGHFTEYYTNMIDCDAPVSCEICGSVNHLTKKCHEIKPCEFISQFARSASEGKCTFFLDIEEVDLQ